MLNNLTRTVVVTGHYGSGKTNLSLNMALCLKKQGREVTLTDLDTVNPYFRSADFRQIAQENGIRLITPSYANSSVDIPSLTGELDARLGSGDTVILDVGGDGDGAYALGRYAPRIWEKPYDMILVVNFFRYLTNTPTQAVEYMREIEAASRLKVTAIVNNSNLAGETTVADIVSSLKKSQELSDITGRPLIFSSVRKDLAQELANLEHDVFPVDIFVKAPW